MRQKSGWILSAVCILGIMIQIDFTAVNVALVDIAKAVNTDLSTVQWALSAYVLAWAALVLTAGRCADLFGKRRTFIAGTLLFMLGSLLTGIATQAWFLIFGRVIQGMGGALFLPGLYTLVFTAFPENKRGTALGIVTSSIALGLAIGPTFGGIVVHSLSWRWIFFLNLPLGIPVIGIILWAVDREPWRLSDEPMDYIGAILIAATLVTLMFSFDHIADWGMSSKEFIITLVTAFILLAIFILFERRQKYPLIQLDIFSNPIFSGSILAYTCMGFNFSCTLIVGNLYLQNALDYSPLQAGFIFLVMTIMFASLSVQGGKLTDRMDPRIPIVLGGLATTAALLILSVSTQYSPLWQPTLALALAGVGTGLGFPALNATMLRSVPKSLLSTASSAFTMFGSVGNALGLITSSLLIVIFGEKKLISLLAASDQVLTKPQQNTLVEIIGTPHYSASQLVNFDTQSIPTLLDTLRTAFIHGMSISLWVAVIIAMAAVIISATLIKPIPIDRS